MDSQQEPIVDEAIRKILIRSNELDQAIDELLSTARFEDDDRTIAGFLLCGISREHAFAIRILVGNDLPTAATALVRLQYEVLVRAAWMAFAAPHEQVPDLDEELTPELEARLANKTPSVAKMLADIVDAGHHRASDEMSRFKEVNWKILNSVVHGGIRPLLIHRNGCSLSDQLNIVQTSNALSTMSAMLLAILSEDDDIIRSVSKIQRPFHDCLPTLLDQVK